MVQNLVGEDRIVNAEIAERMEAQMLSEDEKKKIDEDKRVRAEIERLTKEAAENAKPIADGASWNGERASYLYKINGKEGYLTVEPNADGTYQAFLIEKGEVQPLNKLTAEQVKAAIEGAAKGEISATANKRSKSKETPTEKTENAESAEKTGESGTKLSLSGENNTNYTLESYSQKQIENWDKSKRIIVCENEAQFKQFIQESLANKQYDKKLYLGKISKALANKIKSVAVFDVEGFNCSISSNEIRKIFKDHGTEETEAPRGQRAVTEEDILNIPRVIQQADTIKLSETLYNGKPVLEFSKNIDGKMTVKAIISDKHLDLFIQTAYVGAKKGTLATPTGEQAPINTPKASSGTDSSRNSISHSNKKSNTSDEKNTDTTSKGSIGEDSVPLRESDDAKKTEEEYVEKAFKASPAEVKAAMKAVKGFKLLPASTREAIIEMMRSANGIDKVTVQSIAAFMATREGLHVRFMKGHRAEGSHDVLQKSGQRLILLNPEKMNGKHYRADIFFHELYHDMAATGDLKGLTKTIYEASDPAFQHAVADMYTKYYNGKSISEYLQKKPWTEANVKKYFDTYKGISYDEMREEVAAGTMGRVMGARKFINQLRHTGKLQRVYYGITNICRAIANRAITVGGDNTAGFSLLFRDALEFRRMYSEALIRSSVQLTAPQIAAIREALEESAERDMDTARTKMSLAMDGVITSEMTDTERAAILNKKSIVAPIYEGQADASIKAEENNLKHYKIGVVKAALERLAHEFGVIGQKINIEDVDVKVSLSKKNIGESLSKEADSIQMAKLLPVLKGAVEKSVGIERHDNRYYFDTDTVYFENLLGGFVDGDNLVPVRFGLKHSVTGNATLYVVVDQNKIATKDIDTNKKTEVLTTPGDEKSIPTAARSVIYSVSQIIPFVNSKDVLRYIPDDMLTEEQKKTKWKGIAETVERTNEKNDNKYQDFIKRGDRRAARQMIIAAAKANGYTIKAYHGSEARFTVFDITKSRSWDGQPDYDLPGFYFSESTDESGSYGENVKEYYIKIENPYEGSLYHLAKEKGSYRKAYEFLIAEGYDGYIDAEMGEGYTEYIVLKPENIKSTDVITYDDQDQIVPISKRFDKTNRDTRYSLSLEDYTPTPTVEEMENELNSVKWKFEWTDSKLRDNLSTVRTYISAKHPDISVQIEIDNEQKHITVTSVSRTVDFDHMDEADAALHDFFKSIGIKEDQIGQHLSVFTSTTDKTDVLDTVVRQRHGRYLRLTHNIHE